LSPKEQEARAKQIEILKQIADSARWYIAFLGKMRYDWA
jgi:hypothetical protein